VARRAHRRRALRVHSLPHARVPDARAAPRCAPAATHVGHQQVFNDSSTITGWFSRFLDNNCENDPSADPEARWGCAWRGGGQSCACRTLPQTRTLHTHASPCHASAHANLHLQLRLRTHATHRKMDRERKILVVNRLHQILSPFMLRRMVRLVCGRVHVCVCVCACVCCC
jgi:hypothetical protein